MYSRNATDVTIYLPRYPDEQDGEAGGEEEAVAEPEARRPEQSQPPVDELELGVGPRHQVPALQLLRHEPSSSPSSVISSSP